MSWKSRNRLASYLRSSLWIIPVVAAVVQQIFSEILFVLDSQSRWSGMSFGLDGGKAMCSAVITFALSFIVFTFGSLLVAIQVASGQYTPRIIATTLLRDNVIRYTVGLFVFTLLFAIKALNRIEGTVPQLVVFLAGALGLCCLTAFLFLIDYAARMLRPVSLVKRVGDAELRVLLSVYPEKLDGARPAAATRRPVGEVKRTVLHRGSTGILLAVDVEQLIAKARATRGVIELAPQMGDFLGADEPLFFLYGNAATIEDHTLRGCVIFGIERTMEQDPLFGFRILVDIAIKALSAAINDPTTAVLAIDQLHRVLRSAGRRDLKPGSMLDPTGSVGVIIRTPNWEDFVHLAFTEIRFYGASNAQIARRLRAMLINLTATLPIERHAALHQQLSLLDRVIEKLYELPEDLALARIPDPQGLGGSSGALVPAPVAPKWAA